jgi:hypothetical protein
VTKSHRMWGSTSADGKLETPFCQHACLEGAELLLASATSMPAPRAEVAWRYGKGTVGGVADIVGPGGAQGWGLMSVPWT